MNQKILASNFIPVSSPYITRKDVNSVNRALKSGWISSDGPEIKKFEENFSLFVDRKYSVAVSSGTAALEIAIKALNIKENDEVLIPNFTIISNALAVIRQQAKPVLIDCNLKDWNIKIEDIEKNISINELTSNFVSKIKYIKDRIQSDIFINKFISSFGISKKEFEIVFNKEVGRENSMDNSKKVSNLTPEEMILKILIERRNLRNREIMKNFKLMPMSTICKEIISFLEDNIEFEASQIINGIEQEENRNYVSGLIFNSFQTSSDDQINIQFINDCIKKGQINLIKDKKRRINLQLSRNDVIDENEEKKLLQELKILLDEEKKLKK